jgi:hypothetical protein
VKARGQLVAALSVLLLVVLGGAFLERAIGTREASALPRGVTPSGAWYCPHGGGPTDWTITLTVANPGTEAVRIRVGALGAERPRPARSYTVDPGSQLQLPARADGRGRASIVEYFGGWVAAGWVAHAGGKEAGVAAEPCAPSAGRSWLLPDGTTETEQDRPYLVVMNPFAADAVITVTLFHDDRGGPIRTREWSDVLLRGRRSTAFSLNEQALGYRTVSARVDASIGKVAAASLSVRGGEGGGVRSAVGFLGAAPNRVILPGGLDQGRTELVVMNPGVESSALGAVLQGREEQVVEALQDSSQPAESAGTYPVSAEGASTIDLRAAEGAAGVAAARRTYGVNADQASTAGAVAPSSAWVVLPAVAGEPNTPGLFLWNPGPEAIEVTLSRFTSEGEADDGATATVQIAPGRSVRAPGEFSARAPTAAVLATSTQGTFVPATASYSFGVEALATYAVSIGVPIPPEWIPMRGDVSRQMNRA